jgi:hypothetical protein
MKMEAKGHGGMNVQDCIPASVRAIFSAQRVVVDETATGCAVFDSSPRPSLEPEQRFLLEACVNGLEAIREEISHSHPQLWEPLDRKQQLLDYLQEILNMN